MPFTGRHDALRTTGRALRARPVAQTSASSRSKHVDGESYLAITADGFWDSKGLAVLLDAVPEVSADDWQIEPSEVIGITPTTGQIVYSAMIPPDSLSQVLDQVDDHFL